MCSSRQFLAASMLTLAPVLAAHAQPQSLDQVVVTATRSERPVSETLADVTTIEADEISRAGVASVPELLRALGGVEISHNGGSAGLAGVFVRGTKTSQTVILVDGVRLENPTSATANLETLPLAAIDRIEIVRGPMSSLYGSGAMGGVIQIFTRQGSGAPRPFVSAAVGSRGTAQLQAGVSGASGATRYSLAASVDRTDGWDVTLPYSGSYQQDRDGNGRRSLTGSLSHAFGQGWEAGASLLVSDGHARYDDAWSTPESARFEYRTSSLSTFLRGRPSERWQTELRLGQTRIDYDYDAFSYSPRTASTTLSWQNSIAMPVGSLLLGAEQLRQTIEGDGLTTGPYAYLRDSRRTDSVFAGYELGVDRHLLRLQLRRDRIETAGSETSGTVAWGYRLTPKWLVRASWASAFRAPTFDDLYSPFGSNPDLRPERSRGGELALEYRQGPTLFKATAFSSRIDDAIELDATWTPRNIDSARVEGLTLEGRHRIGAWTLRGAATLQDPRGERFDPAGGGLVSGQLARRAKRHASLGVDWQPSALRLGAELVAQGRRRDSNDEAMAGYGVLALTAGYRLSQELDLFARLDNVGDRAYETAWGYASQPRTLLVGFNWRPR
jgi:vitamin B12 transporter